MLGANAREVLVATGMLLLSCCRRRAAMAASPDIGSAPELPVSCQSQAARGDGWVTYLLVSPTRSSITGFARQHDLDNIIRWHNGRDFDSLPAPPQTQILRPWRLAELVQQASEAQAREAAWQVSGQSGFRARLAALRNGKAVKASTSEALPLDKALDALTYVEVEFSHPDDQTRRKKVLALVDTGCNDCDLKGSIIDELKLSKARRGGTSVETAANRIVEIPIFKATLHVQGHQASVEVSPADEDYSAIGGGVATEDDVDKEFDFSSSSDEAVIGADALASLGLLVDCKTRQLLPADRRELLWVESLPRVSRSHCIHVQVGVRNPDVDGKSQEVRVKALVDTGSTDVDLHKSKIKALNLEVDESELPALFETAGGVTTSAPIYWAVVRLRDREARVRLSPSSPHGDESDESEDDASESSDEDDEEALLGHDALAALGLLVDCKSRRLLLAENVPVTDMQQHGGVFVQKRRRREENGDA
ncbi:unnamed protein product [Effrenium voratum]|uniref:Peptidase A2 domain-containing protein n=1 Tax=Effrenium voratum TaxID=2562239 RepID=A0AA36J6Q3_9DINO|nr:unnamed protein product [Effrenium voratum]CAJ1436414.1 unnamed protein product [Effrenium voratum]